MRRRHIFLLLLALSAGPTIEAAHAQIVPAPKSQAATDSSQKESPIESAWEKFRSLSLADLLDWFREHGPNVVIIVLAAFVILWLANRLHERFVKLLAGYTRPGTAAEQLSRARTVVGVLHNALRTIVIALALLMLLQEMRVPVGPLLGGVAVVGLAVAFGAQSLIKDYFTGLLVLLEQQYLIGDIVKIGAVTGQVEQISLRLTVLRDTDGTVHFIPHGQINFVSNLTHGWTQVVVDLQVPTSESVDRVRDLFFEVVRGMRDEEHLGSMILADPAMLGIESLGEATYVVKFQLRTVAQKRWEVRRELLRRIKQRFSELQIKVSVPA